MAIVMFNKSNGDVEIIYFPKRNEEKIKELELKGYEKVFEYNAKFKDVVCATYFCEDHKVYEILCFTWGVNSLASIWLHRKVNLIETFSNCKYNDLILSIEKERLSFIPFRNDGEMLDVAKKFKELNEVETFVMLIKQSKEKNVKQMIQKIVEMIKNNDANLHNYINSSIKIELLKNALKLGGENENKKV